MNTKNISFLFHNGDYFNLPELVGRLKFTQNIGDSFDHGKEFRQKSQNGYGVHCSGQFTDFDYLASNYDDLRELTIDFSNTDDVKLYFAECCFAWALYYAYNVKANRIYTTELADLKSRIKVCVRHFIDSGLKSKGYWSKFHPHPDYNVSWRFPTKTSKYYRNVLKEYDSFIVTAECADRYFAGVLNMFLVDYHDKTLPEKNNFTQNYKLYLFELCSWIACSVDSRYYRQMLNNFIINYYYWYTVMDGKKPNFYQFAPRFESQMETESNKCYMGMLDVPFCDKTLLCKWVHYDVLFIKNTDRHLGDLVAWMFGELFYTDDTSLRMKEIYTSLFMSMKKELLENPGIVLLMYLGIQKMSFHDFKAVFISADSEVQNQFAKATLLKCLNTNFSDTDMYKNILAYMDRKKNPTENKEVLSQFLQRLFYFMIWDICSAYTFGLDVYYSIKPHSLFKNKGYENAGISSDVKKRRFCTWTNNKENLIANFYEPFLDGTWRNPKTLQNILNLFADFFKFNKKNPFDGIDFLKLSDGNISIFETLPTLIYNLSHGESKTYIIDELNFIRKQYEVSANVIPNLRKEFKSDAERTEIKKRYEENLNFLKECDKGFYLKDFMQSFYPFNYEMMELYEESFNGSYRHIGYELKVDHKDYPLNQSFRLSLRRDCICKFLIESDSDICISNSEGKACKLSIDKEKRFRSIYKNHFFHRYLYNDRNIETHYSPCTAINNLLGNDSSDKKFILTALFDIKKQLSNMLEKETSTEQTIQIEYLKAECNDLFEIIINAYFQHIPEKISVWNYVFNEDGEFILPSKQISSFNDNFSALSLGNDVYKRLQAFFEIVWNIRGIYHDKNDDADFLQLYKLPIELYLIYLSLSFQKYDGCESS